MDKRKVETLRDLAIAHFPDAQKKRADAIRYRGNRFADSGLQSAYLFRKAEWTAVEKQARDLLELTFNHPDALAEYPYHLDAVKDANMIASNASGLEAAVVLQPKIEVAILDAVRLLCELTGDTLPPWVDAVPQAAPAAPAESATDNRPKWEIPERLEYDARQIGEEWMLAEETRTSERPGVDTIAKYVEGELKNRDRRGPRGDYWDWQTVKKEALTGITGRKANGKE